MEEGTGWCDERRQGEAATAWVEDVRRHGSTGTGASTSRPWADLDRRGQIEGGGGEERSRRR